MLDDKNIGINIKQGDSNAFDIIFNALYENLCKYAYGFIADVDDCEDIVQQCFVRLWDNKESASEIKSFKSYLYKAVYNACMSRMKHEKIKQTYQSEAAIELQNIYYSEYENTLPQERIEKIYKEIEALPEKNKEVFTLRFVEGLSTKDVSEKLNITIRTVETHVSKALRILRKNVGFFILVFFDNIDTFDTWF